MINPYLLFLQTSKQNKHNKHNKHNNMTTLHDNMLVELAPFEYYYYNDLVDHMLAYKFNSTETFKKHFASLQGVKATYLKLILSKAGLPECVTDLTSLMSIALTSNTRSRNTTFHLLHFPESFNKLQNLHTLNISLHNVKTLPESFGDLAKLKMLVIQESGITHFPESLGNLLELEEFYIDNNNDLTHLPESIGKLRNLKILIIQNNQNITRLPESIGKLNKKLIEILIINNYNLSELPSTIGNLKNLTTLILLCNSKLTRLPETIGNLANLEKLKVSAFDDAFFNVKDYTMHLPESLGKLGKLKDLFITNYASITEFPECLTNLKSLERLNLSGTRIKSIPESIKNLENLDSLYLTKIETLESLPESLTEMKLLQLLFFDINEKFKFPKSFMDIIANYEHYHLRVHMFVEGGHMDHLFIEDIKDIYYRNLEE